MSSTESGDRGTAAVENEAVTDAPELDTPVTETSETDVPDEAAADTEDTADHTVTADAEESLDADAEAVVAEKSAEADAENLDDAEDEDETVEITAEEAAAVSEAGSTDIQATQATDTGATDTETDTEEPTDAAELEGVHVSSRVRVTLEDGTVREGEIIDDFADLVPGDEPVEARIDHEHVARLRRWAISTDDHDIVFADDDAVELISA
ncbi:hypothetical protein [Gordonia aurantiaca]|uniref:hypothetical protein n=1 Tax=Gordonia sp. B21 TaxID=3151852 RepID=UPI00326694F5